MAQPLQESSALPSAPLATDQGLAIYPVQPSLPPRTLVDILETTISAHPNALALDNGTEHLTYKQLSDRISTQADNLRAAGIAVGDRVGVRVHSGTLDLYISILAVITVGAAYVPVDVDDPNERADLVFSEAGVNAILTDGPTLTTRAPSKGGPQRVPGLRDDAWIIFTSGSTGKPKGVAVSHEAAAAFVDAESRLFLPDNPLGPGDRVLAGLSVAFDASCEEMWLAWRSGACLVPASRALVKAGADLGTFLVKQNITVVSTVPTLAALWPTETLKGVRLLILGGEACPPGLADRLTAHVPSVWNTYGPTEATVVSCAAPLQSGKLVSIGLPLIGWKLAIVGPDDLPVRWGEEGELVIGGVGMARYLDAEKDKVKFAPAAVFNGERAYRSGDLVRAEKDGLYFLGRNDEQIKFGGRRIELGEIDAAMMTLPGVNACAATIQKSEMGNQVLVGYIVRSGPGAKIERNILREILPATLVPMLVEVADIPVRTSGKVDRKALPWPPPASSSAANGGDLDETSEWVSEQWRRILGVPAELDSNFFDLGGTSLSAAQLVSMLRSKCPTMSIADVYEHATLSAMADRVDELTSTTQSVREVKPTPWWTFLVQFPIMLFELLYSGLRLFFTIAFTKKLFALRLGESSWAGAYALPWAAVMLLWALFLLAPGRLIITALLVRLFNLGIKPGTYRRGGFRHIRLWAAERLAATGGLANIAGTQWANTYAWLIGCTVGKDAQLHGIIPTTGLASFGAGCAVESEADLSGWWIDGDIVHVGTVTIGEGAKIGARTTLMPNTRVESYANVPPGLALQGLIKGPGSPPVDAYVPQSMPFLTRIRYTLSIFLLDLVPLAQIAPIYGLTPLVVHDYADFDQLVRGLIYMALPSAIIGAFLYAVVVILLVRLCSIFIRPGSHSWHSAAAWGAWMTHGLLLEARFALFPIYASLFTPTWLRLLGAKIGKNVEASTLVPIPSMLMVKDNAFLADDVVTAGGDLGNGRIFLGPCSVGEKAFVGNSGIVHAHTNVPANSLVGVLGTAPADMTDGSSWLGRPAMSLPRRVEANATNNSKRTFEPPFHLKLIRGLIETSRLSVLVIAGMITNCVGIGMLWMMNTFGDGYAILGVGAVMLAAGILAALITTVAKWTLTPIVRPGQESPLWSNFVWRNELADTFTQCLANPMFCRFTYGTPLINWWLRSMGASIGPGAWLESHFLPEAELCKVGAGATLNRACVMQTHLFHDRLMRLDSVVIEQGATLGPYAIALPGTTVGPNSTIGPTSLVMRGESIPGSSRWFGNPVRPWATNTSSPISLSSVDDKEDKKDDTSSDGNKSPISDDGSSMV